MTNVEADNEIERLKGVVTAQQAALKNWRTASDRDAGRLARYHTALFRIAHGADDLAAVRELAKKELL